METRGLLWLSRQSIVRGSCVIFVIMFMRQMRHTLDWLLHLRRVLVQIFDYIWCGDEFILNNKFIRKLHSNFRIAFQMTFLRRKFRFFLSVALMRDAIFTNWLVKLLSSYIYVYTCLSVNMKKKIYINEILRTCRKRYIVWNITQKSGYNFYNKSALLL